MISTDLKDFEFILQKHKFRIDSNADVYFSLLMDNNCGIVFSETGNTIFSTDKTYTEVVGRDNPPNTGVPSKMIRAINGDIVLDARNGDIVLRGANIRVEGNDPEGGAVIISSTKNFQVNAPITNVQGTSVTIAGEMCAAVTGGYAEQHGEISNEHTKGTDFLKSSFFGKILTAITKFKEFFNSTCGI